MATAPIDPTFLAVVAAAATTLVLLPMITPSTAAFRVGSSLSSRWLLPPGRIKGSGCRNQQDQRPSTPIAVFSAPLFPESSPHAQPDRQSSSGVRYGSVLSGLEVLFPPEALAQRNALSRQDGYWPYIHRGDDPPMPLAYGEFDFYFFAELLDRASKYVDPECRQNSWNGKTFCDLGSGTGRLVLAGAALHPGWKLCRGIELLPLISAEASQALKKCRSRSPTNVIANGQVGPDHNGRDVQDVRHGYELPRSQLPLAPVEFSCGSIKDPYIYFGDSDLVFVFSSCMDADLMVAIATALGRQCRPGALIITTDYMLPLEGEVPPVENPPDERIPTGYYKMKLLERVEGWCWFHRRHSYTG